MRPEEVVKALEPERFRPFKLRILNGDIYEVRHPEQVIVSRSAITIGTQRRDGTRLFEKVDTVSLLHVVSMVPIEETEVS
ncbi:MAG: hypothetical protein KAV82_10715 [Phycisphaerae bacterium]|nr:hypothetical protein [Phycisphaerae bacterium]